MSTTEVEGLICVILVILGIIYCIIKIGQAKKELKMEENQKQQQEEAEVLAAQIYSCPLYGKWDASLKWIKKMEQFLFNTKEDFFIVM